MALHRDEHLCSMTPKLMVLFRILRIPPFVDDKGKDVNSDWLADQWEERSVLGHAQINKGRMKGDDPQIDTAQTPKRFDWRLALQAKIQKTFADSIPTKVYDLILHLIVPSTRMESWDCYQLLHAQDIECTRNMQISI